MNPVPREMTGGSARGLARRVIGSLACALGLAQAGLAGRPGGAPVRPPDLVVDLNRDPRPVVESLPRIGPAAASAIEDARRKRPFRSLDDVQSRVAGVGAVTRSAIAPHVRFPGDGG